MKRNLAFYLKIFAVVFVFTGTLGYGWFRSRDFLHGPVIIVTSPANGTASSTPLIEISGIAKNTSDISLNSRKIFVDTEGNWREKILLHPGYNPVILHASDKFGRETQEVLEFVRK